MTIYTFEEMVKKLRFLCSMLEDKKEIKKTRVIKFKKNANKKREEKKVNECFS